MVCAPGVGNSTLRLLLYVKSGTGGLSPCPIPDSNVLRVFS